MPTAWHIFKARYAQDALSGEGARLYGGRWNSPGTAVVYASSSLALAALEILVPLRDRRFLQRAFLRVELEFEESAVQAVRAQDLPADWQRPEHPALKRIGDEWAAAERSPVLRVPSAVIAQEANYLLNPLHPGFAAIRASQASPFTFDERLLGS